MSFCQFCGTELRQSSTTCENCGRNAEVATVDPGAPPKEITWRGAVVLALVVITFLFLGNFHIVTGSGIGLGFAQRKSFGFSEMFVNADAITSMPFLAAMFKYPLGVQALQREGYIESAEAFQKRVSEETAAMMRKNKEEMDAKLEQALQGTAELFKAMEAEQQKAMTDYEETMRELSTNQ